MPLFIRFFLYGKVPVWDEQRNRLSEHLNKTRTGAPSNTTCIGALAWSGERVWLAYRWVAGTMSGAQVVDFLETLAAQTPPEPPTVVV
jgi:hypothetical protein